MPQRAFGAVFQLPCGEGWAEVWGVEKQPEGPRGYLPGFLSAGCRCPADPAFPPHVSAGSSPAGTEGRAACLPGSGDLQLLTALQVRCSQGAHLTSTASGLAPSAVLLLRASLLWRWGRSG